MLSACFWGCILLVAYTYLGYPAAIWFLAKIRPSQSAVQVRFPTSVSFVLAARHEGARIGARIDELRRQLAMSGVRGEVVVVLDGSPVEEAALPTEDELFPLHIIALKESGGKAAAISRGVEQACSEIVAFADVRQIWKDDALRQLLFSFRDRTVGAVSGDLVLDASGSSNEGVGLYWRYEKWIRRLEGRYDSVVGVTGAICAVRRELFSSMPEGVLLDDVYWPLRVVMQGYRVVHNCEAVAYDRLPSKARDEFRRKVRTLCGNFQLLTLLPSAFVPWRNRIWLQLISHKMLRLVVPWALIIALFVSAGINKTPYHGLFWGQIAVYSIVSIAIMTGAAARFRYLSAAASFLMLNVAAWCAFWFWISGRSTKLWRAVKYAKQ